jgi:hypothetical protein
MMIGTGQEQREWLTMSKAVQRRIEKNLQTLAQKGLSAVPASWSAAAASAFEMAGLDPASPGSCAAVAGAVIAAAYPTKPVKTWTGELYCELIVAFLDLGDRDRKAARSDPYAARELVKTTRWSGLTWKSLRTMFNRALDRDLNPLLDDLIAKDDRVRQRVIDFKARSDQLIRTDQEEFARQDARNDARRRERARLKSQAERAKRRKTKPRKSKSKAKAAKQRSRKSGAAR